MPKSLAFETSSVAHGIGIRPILRSLGLLWCWVLCGKEGDGFCGLDMGLVIP